MKAKTFENLIRKVVREEIDYSLRREIKTLKEDLRDELKPTIIEHTEESIKIPESTKNSLREKIMGTTPIQQHPKRSKHNFVGDNTINDLLNETAMGDTTLDSTMPSSQDPFGTSGILPTETMPYPVASAVNKDYRALMKAIDGKKNK